MKHIFEIEIAVKYGVNAAILLENIGYWIMKNEANRINYHDGTYWTYNSRRAYRDLFPYMSEKQIETAFQKLIDGGIVITGDYNTDRRDRTLWYAITEKGKCILHFEEMQANKKENALCKNVSALPNITENKNTNSFNHIIPDGDEAAKTALHGLFEQFWNRYPRKVDKRGTERAFGRIRGIDELFPKILDALEKQKLSEQWAKDGGRFIPHPKTWINQERWNDTMETPSGSFDTDEFFEAALKRSRPK